MLDILETLTRQRGIPRGDELKTHFADMWTCLHAVALRRRGEKPLSAPAELLAKFQAGLDYEHGVARTLRAAGHKVEEGIDVSYFGLESGHPDLLVDDELVIETKTTDSRKPKDQCQPHHAVQVAAAALAVARIRGLKALRALVLVRHASHIETAYEIAPEPLERQIYGLAKRVIDTTEPSDPLPDPQPTDWLPYDECQYCRWAQCSRNPHHPKNQHPLLQKANV